MWYTLKDFTVQGYKNINEKLEKEKNKINDKEFFKLDNICLDLKDFE